MVSLWHAACGNFKQRALLFFDHEHATSEGPWVLYWWVCAYVDLGGTLPVRVNQVSDPQHYRCGWVFDDLYQFLFARYVYSPGL